MIRRPRRRLAALALVVAASCGDGAAPPPVAVAPTKFRFVDVAAASGLTRVVLSGRVGKDHLLDSTGTGCAWLDYDGDGRLDAYVVNAWRIENGAVAERGKNALYRNRGDGTFEDVAEKAGVDGGGRFGAGVCVADFDADGRPDLFVTNFGANALYRNRGDGTFEDAAVRYGVDAPGWNTGASFFDADGDGDLDLYVARYVDCSEKDVLAATRTLDWKSVAKVAFGPFGMTGAQDRYFRRDADRFVDATAAAGFEDKAKAFGFAVRTADLDDDGDADVYVANDSDPNYFFRNEGGGRFQEIGVLSGSALDRNGAAQAGMGVAMGDVDGDGRSDVFVTNFAEDFSTLYRALPDGYFEDVSATTGVGKATFLPMSWGAALADLDCDGDLDLAIANGHIYPQADEHPELGQAYRQRALLLENDGRGKFADATADAGPGFSVPRVHRGLAAGDYDEDGDLDLLFTQLDGPPVLLRNDSRRGGSLIVACEVPPGRGTAVGARITVRVGEKSYVRDVATGDSFLSGHDARAHFGLGAAAVVDEVAVRWPDGSESKRSKVPTDAVLRVRKDG